MGKALLGKSNRRKKINNRFNFIKLLSTKILQTLKRSLRIKIFAICLIDKRLIGRIYKNLLQIIGKDKICPG